MSYTAFVSVVMGVYNGAIHLPETLESIFDQQDVDFECIVIDDGSTDATASILADWASHEPRLLVRRQEQSGLTHALIAGCSLARGEFIARHDVCDRSRHLRLHKQAHALATNPNVVFVSCKCEMTGPSGESLGKAHPVDGGQGIVESLVNAPAEGMRSPHHGSVMFRRSAYERVGGYRPEFFFAQDLDLWARLIEVGNLKFLDEVLYQSSFSPGDISARHRAQQLRLHDLIREATLLRRNGEEEGDVLDRAAQIRPGENIDHRRRDAQANYFIGSCLYDLGDPAAEFYFRRVIATDPFHFKAWAKWLGSRIRFRA